MRRIFCDKCKDEILGKTGVNFAASDALSKHNIDEFDLCADCIMLLLNWIKEKPTGK